MTHPVLAKKIAIHVGELHASKTPTMIRTLLGSCISVCLYDPKTHIGGMNHFLLPHADRNVGDPARFGVHAMEELVFRMQSLGADRRRLVGKLFGGGHVLKTAESADSVPRQNIRFIEKFMGVEGIPVVSKDLGGRQARVVLFATAVGKAWVRRVDAQPEVVKIEKRIESGEMKPVAYGEVTLF